MASISVFYINTKFSFNTLLFKALSSNCLTCSKILSLGYIFSYIFSLDFSFRWLISFQSFPIFFNFFFKFFNSPSNLAYLGTSDLHLFLTVSLTSTDKSNVCIFSSSYNPIFLSFAYFFLYKSSLILSIFTYLMAFIMK
jgi:hypothetical protein